MALKDLYNYAKQQEEKGKAPAGAKSSLEILVDARERGIKGARSLGGITTTKAKTQAALGKTLSGTKDPAQMEHLNNAIRLVASNLANKSQGGAAEMQEKKLAQQDAKTPVDTIPTKKEIGEKVLSDFDKRTGFDDPTAEYWKRHNAKRSQMQMEVNRAGDEETEQRDLADIAAMTEEDRKALEQYAVNRIRDQNQTLEMAGMMPTAEQEAAGLIGKYGKQRADELAETFMRQQNKELAEQTEAAGREFANENPFWASVSTVPANLMAAIAGTVGQLQGAARSTGRYSTLDANETGTALDKFSGAVREQTAQNIEGEDPNALRKGASWLYQGGMSLADSTARLLATGGSAGISAAIAASGAFSQGLQKYSAMGAGPEQAALAATASAGLEYITEKLPTEKVLELFHKGGNKNAVKEVLKQAFFVEPAGEEVNLFAGMAAEALILGENSSKQQRIGDLIAGGMTKAEAEKQFWKETFQEAVNTYAVSAVAGGLGAGGAALAGNQVQTAQDQKQAAGTKEALIHKYGVDQNAGQNEAAVSTPERGAPAEDGTDQLKQVLETTAADLQEKAPEAAPAVPMTEQQKHLQQAIEAVVGVDKQQEPTQNEIVGAVGQDRSAESDYYDEFEDFNAGGADRRQFMGRSWDEVGKRSVKAYMYENPEVKPYFQAEAQVMLMELADSTRGERFYNEDSHYESGGENGWGGVKRNTSDDIAYLLDSEGFSYEDIEKGLKAIVEDNGAENNAASKRIEFILHNRLMNGKNDFYSNDRVPASDDYVNLINEKHITTYDAKQEATASNMNASASKMDATPESPQAEDRRTVPAMGGQPQTVTEKDGQQVMNGFAARDFRASNTYMNTGLHSENANIRKGYRQELRKNSDAALYGVKHNADTLAEAQSRIGTKEQNAAALNDLLNKDHWTPEDVATSTLLLDQIMASGDNGAIAQLNALRQKRKEAGTYSGQVVQSFAIHNPTMAKADSPATAVDSFRARLNGMKQEETTWSAKSGVPFETWKEQIQEDVDRIGIAIATVEDGDSDSMRQIIRQIAGRRKTTAWFGTSENLTNKAWGILKNLEFEDLKKIANTQLVAMADDYRARSKGEVIGGLRKQSMLSSLKTFTRNIAGNTVGGFADAVSESGAGRMVDAVLSKFTGKRTVGNDLMRATTYAKASKEAGQFASLCVELNIPIETDVESSYAAAAGEGSNSKYLGKTFRATGNPAMRALYAYQKYMSYALEVTDKVFEGGTNAAVAESLNRLRGANLTQEEMDSLGEFTANKRTYKNATWEEDGQTKGAVMARKGSQLKKDLGVVGEVAMPYVNVPMNVAQTGIDYTAGVAKGLGEMVSIIKDAKAGKTIPVERQRQAASDFGRGVTGTTMIALFASAAAMGALKASNSEDWDKEALAQAEGRSGAQINWSALVRGLNGEDAKWETGDVITSMDFLEPFNTQMYLGAELAQAEDINLITYAGSTIKSVWQSLMDSPVMTGLADIEQTLKDITEAETLGDQLNVGAGYVGDVASSFVPQFVRQAAQNQDGYYRDTRGDTALESAMNSFKAAIPGLSEALPKKYSGLGEEQKRGSGVETFLDPTGTKVYEENEVTTFLDELSGRTKDNGIYPDRQAPMRITVAGRDVALDGSMRETYQKTYGEAVNAQYRSLMSNKDFQSFSDEQKTASLKAALGNAKKLAMAAVSDYKDAPTGSASQLAKEIVNKQVRSQISDLFSDLNTQREYGYSTKETAAKMDAAYDAFQDLSKQTQKQILDQATSDTARYLQARQGGISTDQYLTATQRIGALKPENGNKNPSQVQKVEAIAKQTGLTEEQRVLMGKLYGSDAQDENIDEVTSMGYDFEMYTKLYRDHEDYTKGTGKKKRTIAHWQEKYGFDYNTAKALYEVFS